MDSTCELIIDSLKEEPIGETDHFIWFITDIGIVALFKREENFETYSSNVKIEANKIALDITKEEKEYLKIKGDSFSCFIHKLRSFLFSKRAQG